MLNYASEFVLARLSAKNWGNVVPLAVMLTVCFTGAKKVKGAGKAAVEVEEV